LAKRRAQKYKTKYTTLWESAKDFTKTKLFTRISRGIKKQMIAKHSEGYYGGFLRDEHKQIKFVLNMFRDIKQDDDSKFPKTLHQIGKVFTPPKEIIYGKADLAEKVLSKDWVNNMVSGIGDNEFFRWQSGIRSKEHLNKIFEVCRLTPKTNHLLHTAEITVLKQITPTDVPENMLLRLMLYKTKKGTTPNEINWPWTFLVDETPPKKSKVKKN
jgi:hypothetical protein